MWWSGRCFWALVGGAFALGILLTWLCAFRLALFVAVFLLLALCRAVLRRW